MIATASQLADTGDRYESLFTELGAGRVRALPFESRADCDRPELLEKLVKATGIFLTGGNQLRLATTLGGTDVARTIRTLVDKGLLERRPNPRSRRALVVEVTEHARNRRLPRRRRRWRLPEACRKALPSSWPRAKD